MKKLAAALFFIIFIAGCSSSSNDAKKTTAVSMEEVQITDDLLVKELTSCEEDTLCVQVNWAKPTDVFGEHSRRLRLAAEVGGEWKLLWENNSNGGLAGSGIAADIPLSEYDANWLFRADKAILSATQCDAQDGSNEPRILVSSRELRTNPDEETQALQIVKGANLSDVMLVGADLSGLDLSAVYLPRASLQCADLSYTNLSGADLAGVDLSGTDMSGATWLDGQQCGNPSTDGCDLPVPDGIASKKECGTYITLTNNSPTGIRCTQDCSNGRHDPCSATIGIKQSQVFYGYGSVWGSASDIDITCIPIKEIILPYYIKAQQPAKTSWIRLTINGATHGMQTAKQGSHSTVDLEDTRWILRNVLTRLNGPHSQDTHWGFSQTTIPYRPSSLVGVPGSISGSIMLRWFAPVNHPEAPVTNYTIKQLNGDSPGKQIVIQRTGGDIEEYLYTDLTPGDSYCFNVAAWNGMGWSDWSSNAVCVHAK